MKLPLLLGGLLLVYGVLLGPFATHMQQRPVEVKLGYMPHPQILKVTSADLDLVVAEAAVVKVLFYYGTLIDKLRENVIIRPEFLNMYRTLDTVTQLDPYNSDAYYFLQASFTWDIGRIREVNELLEWGMQHRTWDPWLAFYLGFNHAYFLKDYRTAAVYMQQAAELSGNPLFTNLAARYFYESRHTDLGMTFLDEMINSAKDPAVRRSYEIRRLALMAVDVLEKALEAYSIKHNSPAGSLDDLVKGGFIDKIPSDPYGGQFYMDDTGRVRSTSKFANPNS